MSDETKKSDAEPELIEVTTTMAEHVERYKIKLKGIEEEKSAGEREALRLLFSAEREWNPIAEPPALAEFLMACLARGKSGGASRVYGRTISR